MISVVCYFLLFPVGFALKITIYGPDYYSNSFRNPLNTIEKIYEFTYHLEDLLAVDIRLKIDPNVTASIIVTNETVTPAKPLSVFAMSKCINIDACHRIHDYKLRFQSVFIGLKLNSTSKTACTEHIMKGTASSDSINERNKYCISPKRCIMEIDLQDDCKDIQETQYKPTLQALSSSLKHMLTYVIPSVTVMTVLLIMLYLCVKKYRRRIPDPVVTSNLKNYAADEVVYADLGLAPAPSQLPRRDEESPYAQIIGVLKPDK